MALTSALFPILVLAGIFMRTVQAGGLSGMQEWFYPLMTLHGVGMAGVWFVASMACASDALSRHVQPSERIGRVALAGTLIGVVLLLVCVRLGRFAAGWYFLYPLPLKGEWPAWAAVTFLLSLTALGATWLVWTLDLLRAIARRYTLPQALGWHMLAGRSEPALPPLVLITTVSLIAGVAALLSGVVVLVLYYLELFAGLANDALLMKNLTFFFGHTLVNLSMYLGVGLVYEVLPDYAGRPWKANRVVAISWNAVLLIVLSAYFHHLYLDFAQPGALQTLGHFASYASAIPAAVVTIFGALLLVYRSRMRWTLASLLLFLGLSGWAIGGVALRAAGLGDELEEIVHVDRVRGGRVEGIVVVAADDVLRGAVEPPRLDRGAKCGDDDVQAVRAHARLDAGPEQIGQLVPMRGDPVLQDQQLEPLERLAPPECLRRDLLPVLEHVEGAEAADRKPRRGRVGGPRRQEAAAQAQRRPSSVLSIESRRAARAPRSTRPSRCVLPAAPCSMCESGSQASASRDGPGSGRMAQPPRAALTGSPSPGALRACVLRTGQRRQGALPNGCRPPATTSQQWRPTAVQAVRCSARAVGSGQPRMRKCSSTQRTGGTARRARVCRTPACRLPRAAGRTGPLALHQQSPTPG